MDGSPGMVITLADERETSLGVDARAVSRCLERASHHIQIRIQDFDFGHDAVVSVARPINPDRFVDSYVICQCARCIILEPEEAERDFTVSTSDPRSLINIAEGWWDAAIRHHQSSTGAEGSEEWERWRAVRNGDGRKPGPFDLGRVISPAFLVVVIPCPCRQREESDRDD